MRAETLNATSRPQGFSLIEVLLAVVILSVGLLALATLQAALVRGAAFSKAQSVAISLAEDKIETLRAFSNSTAYRALTSSGSAETLNPTGDVTYSRTTTVRRYCKNSTNATYLNSTDNSGSCPITGTSDFDSDFKRVVVAVTWTASRTGDEARVELEDNISAVAPGAAGRVSTSTTTTRPDPQVRIFTPTEQGIIPIATGDSNNNQSSATSNPKPVQEASQAGALITRFNVQTYLNDGQSNPLLQRRIENVVTACKCVTKATANTSSSTNGRAAYEPTYWNGKEYVEPRKIDGKVIATTQNLINDSQDTDQFDLLCEACCRDHHDAPATATNPDNSDAVVGASVTQRTAAQALLENPPPYRFDPYRPSNGNSDTDNYNTSTGDHWHYDRNDDSSAWPRLSPMCRSMCSPPPSATASA
jgi:type IV pilus modification protein PilV